MFNMSETILIKSILLYEIRLTFLYKLYQKHFFQNIFNIKIIIFVFVLNTVIIIRNKM